MTDRAEIRDPSEAQIARWLFEFKLHGFIMFRSLLPVDLIEAMNEQFATFLSLEMEMAERGNPLSGRGPRRFAVNIGGLVERLGGPLNDPRARRNPIIETLAGRILGRWRHSKTIVETPCQGSDYMHWHGDTVRKTRDPGRPKRTTQLKLHIPLVDVTEQNGPIEIIPGSHRMNYVEGHDAVEGIPELVSLKVLTRKGDCFLRDGDLIHRGTPNRTAAPRPMYTQSYKKVD